MSPTTLTFQKVNPYIQKTNEKAKGAKYSLMNLGKECTRVWGYISKFYAHLKSLQNRK